MKIQNIDKEKNYNVVLSGAQIIWIQTILTQAKILNLNEHGEEIADIIYQTLEKQSGELIN